jgi:hypothetical protein
VSDLQQMDLLPNSPLRETLRVVAVAGDELRRRSRGSAGVGIGCRLLLLALSAGAFAFAPVAFGQGQAGAATQGQAAPVTNSSGNTSASGSLAKPQAGAAGPTAAPSASDAAAQKTADGSLQNEPKMEDQSAPAAESLGEAARRARAQKTQAAKPKVYNDDSVTKLSGHGVSVVGDGNSGGGGASYSGSSESGGGGGTAQGAAGSQESYWRGRANEIRKQMAACDQKIGEIQDEIAKHGAVSVDPMSGAQAGVIFVEDRNAQIKQVEHQKDELQGQLDALAEEGRKAGADSGWFR